MGKETIVSLDLDELCQETIKTIIDDLSGSIKKLKEKIDTLEKSEELVEQ